MYEENGNIKYPIGKSIFAVNLPLKLYRVTIANTDTESLKSLHTLFDTFLSHMLAQFEPNRMVQKVQNFKLFDKKRSFFNHFRQSVYAVLQDILIQKQLF